MDVTMTGCAGSEIASEYDERLADSVVAQLDGVLAYPESDPIEIEVCEGKVTLRGAVLAREMIEVIRVVSALAGVRGLDNQLVARSAGFFPTTLTV